MAKNIRKERREKKKRHILEIAKSVFAQKGYEASSIGEIAERASVSKWNMYYYAGDKRTLYTDVIDDLVSGVWKVFPVDIESSDSASDLMMELFRGLAIVATDFLYHGIVLRELISGGEALPDKLFHEIGDVVGLCENIIEKGKRQGEFRDVNPYVVFMMIFGAVNYYQIITPFLNKIGTQNQYIDELGTSVRDKVVKEFGNILLEHMRKKDKDE